MSALSEEIEGSSCDLPCAGDDNSTCGGHLSLTVYRKNAATGLQPPGPKGGVGSLLALGVAVVALLYLVW